MTVNILKKKEKDRSYLRDKNGHIPKKKEHSTVNVKYL